MVSNCIPGCNTCCNMKKNYIEIEEDFSFHKRIKNTEVKLEDFKIYECPHNDENGLCLIYEIRPNLCKKYECDTSKKIKEISELFPIKKYLKTLYEKYEKNNNDFIDSVKVFVNKINENIKLVDINELFEKIYENKVEENKKIISLNVELLILDEFIQEKEEECKNEIFQKYSDVFDLQGSLLTSHEYFHDTENYVKSLIFENKDDFFEEFILDKILDITEANEFSDSFYRRQEIKQEIKKIEEEYESKYEELIL